jgi:hypothetical protein
VAEPIQPEPPVTRNTGLLMSSLLGYAPPIGSSSSHARMRTKSCRLEPFL